MFGEEFYPTPTKIIGKMLEPLLKPKYPQYESKNIKLINNMTILEPSAGKGNICDYIRKVNRDADIYCIEQDPNLKHILHGKGYRVIADDFLTYSGDHLFDLIIMNPPFSNGVDHVLKAWEIVDDGHVISLLNSNTILNPNSEKKKHLLSLIEKYGSVEHIGQVFLNSKDFIKSRYRDNDPDEYDDGQVERTTSVECCIVRLKKEVTKTKFDFEFKAVNKEKHVELNEDTFKDPIATRDVIGNMIIQYDHMKEIFVQYMKIVDEMCFYGQELTYSSKKEDGTEIQSGPIDVAMHAYKSPSNTKTKKAAYNEFCDNIKSTIWDRILRKTNIQKYMTHSVRKNWSEFCKQQGYMDFTKENVAAIVAMIFNNRYDILEKAIVEVFDMFTSHHAENRYLVEGWKTNDKWKVNRKVILPRWISYGNYTTADSLKRYGDRMQCNYNYQSEYSDIDKVMCYITGQNHDTCNTLYESLNWKLRSLGTIRTGDKFDNTGESQFFTYKFWKKGTLHIEFKDKSLWEEFNMRACAGKMWLPETEEKAWRKKKEPAPTPEKPAQLMLGPATEILPEIPSISEQEEFIDNCNLLQQLVHLTSLYETAS